MELSNFEFWEDVGKKTVFGKTQSAKNQILNRTSVNDEKQH